MKPLASLPYRDREFTMMISEGRNLPSLIGAFFIPIPNTGKELKVIATNLEWEHVSISTPYRCPTWQEMVYIKNFFWDESETVIQVHPKKSQYVNVHPYCLHLWRDPKNVYDYPIAEMLKRAERNGLAFFSRRTVSNAEIIDGKKCVTISSKHWLTWQEICQIKKMYFDDEQPAVQVHTRANFDLNSYHVMSLWEAPAKLPEPRHVV